MLDLLTTKTRTLVDLDDDILKATCQPMGSNGLNDEVLLERQDATLVVTICRPDARNAVNQATAQGIAMAMDEFEADDELCVAVLTGAGGTFSSGMDLKAFAAGESIATHRGLLGMTERPPSKPIIAAVEGWALAGGCELALSCDLIVASRDAKFGIPEVQRGIVAAAGGLLRLPLAVPYQTAMELALTGEPLTAERAHDLGMVNRLAEPGEALPEAMRLANTIARNGPLAVRTSKWIMSTTVGWDTSARWEHQREPATAVLQSDDAIEGARAFAEKREPRWVGR